VATVEIPSRPLKRAPGYDRRHIVEGHKKLKRLTKERDLSVKIINLDMRLFPFEDSYDLIISHGRLHLIEREHWTRLIRKIQASTKRNGYNIISVFTDRLPPPADLQNFTIGLFKEGELFDYYRDWTVIYQNSRIFDDELPGSVRYRHATNKIVAQKP
jgi:tellurite methyltransferase